MSTEKQTPVLLHSFKGSDSHHCQKAKSHRKYQQTFTTTQLHKKLENWNKIQKRYSPLQNAITSTHCC